MPIIKKKDQIARMHLLQEITTYLDTHYVPISISPAAAPSPVSYRIIFQHIRPDPASSGSRRWGRH